MPAFFASSKNKINSQSVMTYFFSIPKVKMLGYFLVFKTENFEKG